MGKQRSFSTSALVRSSYTCLSGCTCYLGPSNRARCHPAEQSSRALHSSGRHCTVHLKAMRLPQFCPYRLSCSKVCLDSSRNHGSIPLVSVVRNYGGGMLLMSCDFFFTSAALSPRPPAFFPTPFHCFVLFLSPSATRTHIRKKRLSKL